MPYIAIKAYPKDDETKKALAEKICRAVVETVGCPEKAVSISFEEFAPEEWDEKVRKPFMEPLMDKMLIVSGEKKY